MEYDIVEFAKRFNYLLKTTGKTAKELALLLHIPQSAVSDWKKGKSGPKIKTLVHISLLFNVTLDWLILGTESLDTLSADELALIKYYRNLDTFEKGKVSGILETLSKEQSELLCQKK